jgi:hypothetical protein
VAGVTATVIGAVIVTWEDPDLVVSAMEVAVTATVAGVGTAAGAVYTPLLEIIPTVALPPVTPLTLQVTVVLDAFVTVAVKV